MKKIISIVVIIILIAIIIYLYMQKSSIENTPGEMVNVSNINI